VSTTFYVDVDDVLAETTRHIAALAAERFGCQTSFDQLTTFDLGVSLGLAPAQLRQLWEAVHAPEFLEGLPAREGAARALGAWAQAGRHITVVTGRPTWTRASTQRWLERHAIPFGALEVVDKYGRYRDAESAVPLQRLAGLRIALAVEDSLEMAEFLVCHGAARVFLMDRPWNRDAAALAPGVRERLERVAHWDEIAAAVGVDPGIRWPHPAAPRREA
jgi:uncharacterized HAD superfamily protein